jgi:hypothetical protein
MIGGPKDEVCFRADSAAFVTVTRGGLMHRYIRTGEDRRVPARIWSSSTTTVRPGPPR